MNNHKVKNNTKITYILQDNIDFFSELNDITNNNSGDICSSGDDVCLNGSDSALPSNTKTTAETNPVSSSGGTAVNSHEPECLLTKEPLRPDHIKLECGHTFNYIPLFKEVIYQKCNKIDPKCVNNDIVGGGIDVVQGYKNKTYYNKSLSNETTRLSTNEIKCPYCRTIIKKLLPYYPYENVKYIVGVNYPAEMCMEGHTCSSDPDCKNPPIYKEPYGFVCKSHLRLHNKNNKINKINKKETTKKETTAKKKTTTKKETINQPSQNEVGGIGGTLGCKAILVYGANKGYPCGAKVGYGSSEFCKRHAGKYQNTGSVSVSHSGTLDHAGVIPMLL